MFHEEAGKPADESKNDMKENNKKGAVTVEKTVTVRL